MGTVTAIEQVEQIRRELRELDLKCPVDRRRAEKEAEARALEVRDAKQQQQTANWVAWIDNRILQYIDHYCVHVFKRDDADDIDRPTIMNAGIGAALGSERKDRHKELKAAIEEVAAVGRRDRIAVRGARHDGCAYIARSDSLGLCPGEGWEPLSKRGKQGRRGDTRGPQGEKGAKGDKGDDALEIVNWHVDPVNYRAVPFMSNGRPGKPLELRALFERFLEEVGG
jgi:hypothetical protein